MKTLLAATTALALCLPGLAEAGPKGNGNGNGNGRGAWAEGEFCPPGLRHRTPPCVPPGQARHDRGDDRDGDHEEQERGEDYADRLEDEIRDIVEEADLSRDERQALAIVGGLMGLALAQQRAAAASAASEPAPTVSRLAIPEAPPLRPAWIEALASTALGDAALPDAEAVAAAAPTALAPAPLPRTSLIPPPPPLAEDVTGLLGGSVADSGF